MSWLLEVDIGDVEQMSLVAKSLSMPARIKIVSLLYYNPLSVQDIAKTLDMPMSSAGFHVRILEEAGIIRSEKHVADGASYKICYIQNYFVHFHLRPSRKDINKVNSTNIPIGSYMDCFVESHCGLISDSAYIGNEDDVRAFYMPERIDAQLIWMKKGFLEYKVPNNLPAHTKCKRLTLSMELCSEAPGYDETYKSDIYLTINRKSCGFFRSEGDYGARRGILNPPFYKDGMTQYGKLVVWSVDEEGSFINGERSSDMTISNLTIENSEYIQFRVGNRDDSVYCGGMCIFGDSAGDYSQHITLLIEW